jgi:hypothetical protein
VFSLRGPIKFNLLILEFSLGVVAGRKHEWPKSATMIYKILNEIDNFREEKEKVLIKLVIIV